jgi:NB-ARC domain-containing protein
MELEQKILSNNDQVRKMAITGLGGVGKTQIALEVAYQVRDRKPEFSIFWIPSKSIEMIEQTYMSIGKHLGLQGTTPAEMKMLVKAHLSSEKAGPWLLIVDNVDDMNIWLTSDGSSPALNTYLPQSKHGFVLFTSRNRQLATELVGPDVINICQMDGKMATDLLRVSLIEKNLVNDHQSTTQLLRQLSCLPLAITQAATYINETEISVATYLSLLQSQENVMVELLTPDFEDEWRYTGINNSVAVTWLISFNQIQRLNPLAADYLFFMSCIDPRDIPLSLLPPDSSQVKQQNALGLLKAYSFTAGQADGHRLVHVVTKNL